MAIYFISFVKDNKNVGVCIVEAKNERAAHKKTLKLKINPGGQAMISALPEDSHDVQRWGKNVYISPEELLNDGYKKGSDVSDAEWKSIQRDPRVSMVCEKHNK